MSYITRLNSDSPSGVSLCRRRKNPMYTRNYPQWLRDTLWLSFWYSPEGSGFMQRMISCEIDRTLKQSSHPIIMLSVVTKGTRGSSTRIEAYCGKIQGTCSWIPPSSLEDQNGRRSSTSMPRRGWRHPSPQTQSGEGVVTHYNQFFAIKSAIQRWLVIKWVDSISPDLHWGALKEAAFLVSQSPQQGADGEAGPYAKLRLLLEYSNLRTDGCNLQATALRTPRVMQPLTYRGRRAQPDQEKDR